MKLSTIALRADWPIKMRPVQLPSGAIYLDIYDGRSITADATIAIDNAPGRFERLVAAAQAFNDGIDAMISAAEVADLKQASDALDEAMGTAMRRSRPPEQKDLVELVRDALAPHPRFIDLQRAQHDEAPKR